ncbi:hypothetical protein WIS52_01045 [Pseudonocardia nematodicida]|uniref:Uncharacterized protein n=1 Tax=Pseudonocardia nematodicida TaxID=1206997 RepID=A0ABV1K3K8_9PSEU
MTANTTPTTTTKTPATIRDRRVLQVISGVLLGSGRSRGDGEGNGSVRSRAAPPMVSVARDGWVLELTGDGVPHPRSFGTFARVLGRYVRKRGVLTPEETVRKMTSLPASRLGLDDRGVLQVGPRPTWWCSTRRRSPTGRATPSPGIWPKECRP